VSKPILGKTGISAASFLTQQCIAGFIPLLVFLVSSPLLSSLFVDPEDSSNGVSYIVVGGVALLLAFFVAHFFGGAHQSGRWVWILPGCVWLIFFMDEIIDSPASTHPLGTQFRKFLYPGPKGPFGDVVLLTFPFFSSACYSIAIVLFSKMSRSHNPRQHPI
jgi:hypothetical protein